MMKGLFLTIFFMLSLGVSFAQNGAVAPLRCATDIVEEKRLGASYELYRENFERWMSDNRDAVSARAQEIITLPVIVHVIHNNEIEGKGANISADQIYSQLEILNQDFRRKQGSPGYNTDPAGADVRIEFCPARVDPKGNILSEPGINRISRNSKGFSAPPYNEEYVNGTIKPQTYWDPNGYMNIWVCNLQSNDGRTLLGYAQYPSSAGLTGIPEKPGSAETDGIVINYMVFGKVENTESPYRFGRTTTHEIGHWLGLIHVWGDGDCNADDYCEDTPRANGPTYGCPENEVSCTYRNMVENYMQYTDDACMNIFTQNQLVRIQTVMRLSPRRSILARSNTCSLPETAPVARFEVFPNKGCTGTTIQYTSRSTNLPTNLSWDFPGGNPSQSNETAPRVTYSAPGKYSATLTARNAYGTGKVTQTNIVEITSSARNTIYYQDFESGASGWEINNPDNSVTWEIANVEGTNNGQKAYRLPCYEYPDIGARDRLLSPEIDLSSFTDVQLAFNYAYRAFGVAGKDSLIVLASTDGGKTFPFTLFRSAESGKRNFATNSPTDEYFLPLAEKDWCFGLSGWARCPSINLAAFSGQRKFRLAFEVYNGFGNNIYLDDISITSICNKVSTGTRPEHPSFEMLIYPNPSTGNEISININSVIRSNSRIELINSLGTVVFYQNTHILVGKSQIRINFPELRPGLYLLKMSGPKGEVLAIRSLLIGLSH